MKRIDTVIRQISPVLITRMNKHGVVAMVLPIDSR